MKVLLTVGRCSYDKTKTHIVSVDGKEKYSIQSLSECPEDAIIGRDLIDGENIIEAIKLGYEAGKRGEELEISKETESEEDQ